MVRSWIFSRYLTWKKTKFSKTSSGVKKHLFISFFFRHLATQETDANVHVIKPQPKHVAGTQAQLFALHSPSRALTTQTDVINFYLRSECIHKHSALLTRTALGWSLILIYIFQKC